MEALKGSILVVWTVVATVALGCSILDARDTKPLSIPEYLDVAGSISTGSTIQLTGYLVIEFENCSIWATREQSEDGPAWTGIWLNLKATNCLDMAVHDLEFAGPAVVQGKSDPSGRGRFGMFGAELDEVEVIRP
jgi:hypothetical protein